MKIKELHDLIQQHIQQVNHLDTETDEVAEGECSVWAQDDCTFMIEFANQSHESPALIGILQEIASKLDYLQAKRDDIIQIITQRQHINTEAMRLVYTAFFVESECDVFCEFAVSAPSWGEKMAELSLESNNQLIYHGLE